MEKLLFETIPEYSYGKRGSGFGAGSITFVDGDGYSLPHDSSLSSGDGQGEGFCAGSGNGDFTKHVGGDGRG